MPVGKLFSSESFELKLEDLEFVGVIEAFGGSESFSFKTNDSLASDPPCSGPTVSRVCLASFSSFSFVFLKKPLVEPVSWNSFSLWDFLLGAGAFLLRSQPALEAMICFLWDAYF